MSSDLPTLIYVVDDDPAVLHSTRFLLECEGHGVEAFASGRELLAVFPGPAPCCVLLDQVMPGMDGLEVFGRLRNLDARVPVVLITGHPDPGIRTRARKAGVPLIEKPLALAALWACSQHSLVVRHPGHELEDGPSRDAAGTTT